MCMSKKIKIKKHDTNSDIMFLNLNNKNYFSSLLTILDTTSFALAPSKALRTSIGTAKIIVLDWSEDKSLSVDNVLKCRAPGELYNFSSASAKFLEASSSP